MTNLKELLDKVKNEQNNITNKPITESFDEEYGSSEEEYEEGPICYYLNEDGTCSDGCSCAEVEIEQSCPFLAAGNYEECCCYEEAYYDDSAGNSEFEEEIESDDEETTDEDDED